MIRVDLTHCETLEEFYPLIREQHDDFHGKDYCAIHDVVRKLMKEEGVDKYKELGVNQGGTAANACLLNPKKIELIDNTLEQYNVYEHLFKDYCEKNNIELVARELDSASVESRSQCDLLLIDSLHKPSHLIKELNIHAEWTSKYIVCHDTYRSLGQIHTVLHDVLEGFCKQINSWEIIEKNTDNVGYTVIAKGI